MTNSEKNKIQPSQVVRRNDEFVSKTETKICYEEPSKSNPYIAESTSYYGYDLIELLNKRSYVDVMYLIFRGDLPSVIEANLFEKLMIAFINPGPRHPATRAAMNAGIGKTDSSHVLPIGLTILGGSHLGGAEVESSMRWLRRNSRRDPVEVAEEVLLSDLELLEDDKLAPGFGKRFDDVDIIPRKIAGELMKLPASGKILNWADKFSQKINEQKFGWLSTGVVAATLCDLGFQPRTGPGVYQVISAPGIFAHGIEMANKPITAMPFLDDADYFMETELDEINTNPECRESVE